MTGDRDGQAPGKATLLVIAVDGILGTHRSERIACTESCGRAWCCPQVTLRPALRRPTI